MLIFIQGGKYMKRIRIDKVFEIIISSLISVVLIFSFTSCSFFDSSDNPEEDINTNLVIPKPTNKMFINYTNWDYNSFVKLKVNATDGALYANAQDRFYLLYECEVDEDYYGLIPKGEKVALPIFVDSEKPSEELCESLKSIFNTEYILVYGSIYEDEMFISCDQGVEYHFDKVMYNGLENYHAIPINEQGLNLKAVEEFLLSRGKRSAENKIPGFSEYLRHGMNEQELRTSIRRLDYEQELRNSRYYGNGIKKYRTELLEVISDKEGVSVSVEPIGIYLDYITVTITNNLPYAIEIIKGFDMKHHNENLYWVSGASYLAYPATPKKYEKNITVCPGEKIELRRGIGFTKGGMLVKIINPINFDEEILTDESGKYDIAFKAKIKGSDLPRDEEKQFIIHVIIDVDNWYEEEPK